MLELYEIPQFSRYLITISGNVLNKETNAWLRGSTNPDGYHNYRLKRDDDVTTTIGRHRLLLIVFKPPPRNVDICSLHVNHRNGIKGDDRLDNLEWMSPKSNCEHAGDMGLSPKCNPVQVRETKTGYVNTFPSYFECSTFYSVTKDYVRYWVNKGPNFSSSLGLQFRRFSSDIWPDDPTLSNPPSVTLKNSYQPSPENQVHLKSLKTGYEFTFGRIVDAANFLGVSYATIEKWLALANQPVLPGLFLAQKGSNIEYWREVRDPYKEIVSFYNRRPVKVTNDNDGSFWLFESVEECSNFLGITKDALYLRLTRKYIVDNLVIEYYN